MPFVAGRVRAGRKDADPGATHLPEGVDAVYDYFDERMKQAGARQAQLEKANESFLSAGSIPGIDRIGGPVLLSSAPIGIVGSNRSNNEPILTLDWGSDRRWRDPFRRLPLEGR